MRPCWRGGGEAGGGHGEELGIEGREEGAGDGWGARGCTWGLVASAPPPAAQGAPSALQPSATCPWVAISPSATHPGATHPWVAIDPSPISPSPSRSLVPSAPLPPAPVTSVLARSALLTTSLGQGTSLASSSSRWEQPPGNPRSHPPLSAELAVRGWVGTQRGPEGVGKGVRWAAGWEAARGAWAGCRWPRCPPGPRCPSFSTGGELAAGQGPGPGQGPVARAEGAGGPGRGDSGTGRPAPQSSSSREALPSAFCLKHLTLNHPGPEID